MLEHASKISVRWRFGTKVAESSNTALKLWKTSNLELAKVGDNSSKKYSPFKPIGRTKAGVKYRNRVFLYSRYNWSADTDIIWIHQWFFVDLETWVDTSKVKKWLTPKKKDCSLQKQLEREAQEKKEALCTQEFSKRSARVITCLRQLEKVRKSCQFVPETLDFRHKTAMSDYFTHEEALISYTADFVIPFQSTHLKEAIPRSASWQLSLEAGRKDFFGKREKQAIGRPQQIQRRA